MRHLNYSPVPRTSDPLSVQIEPADDCDGSLCHQPIFTEDGELNLVPPHCHMIEWSADGVKCHAVFCDFPAQKQQQLEHDDALFANYPPFLD